MGSGNQRLANRVAVVTGGASGMGQAICEAFIREGAKLALLDIDEARAHSVAEKVGADTGQCAAFQVDVSASKQVQSTAQRIADRFGQVDIVVNNAGVRLVRPFLEHTDEDWDRMLNVNLTAQFYVARAFAPWMVERKWGRIINIASIASFVGRPDRIAYCAAKAGILGLTRALAADLRHTGVTANAIAPGSIATPLNAQAHGAQGVDWARETMAGRWGEGDDIARAALYLASDDASYVNGTTLVVDGGWLAVKDRDGEVSRER